MALDSTVHLINTVPDVVLTGNQVPLKFQASTNMLVSAGTKAEVILTWTAVALANEYFDLLLAGETVRFTCKASPDESGQQFHDNTGSLTLNNWVALIGADIQKNYLLSRYYDVVIAGASVTITAKETGSEYSQEFTAGSGIDVTATETNKTGTNRELQQFYAIAVLLYCDSQFVRELLVNVDDDGLGEVDISKLLESYLEADFQWPESDSVYHFQSANAIKPWYFRFGERYGAASYKAMQLSQTYYAMAGGLSFMQQAKFNADGSNFWSQLNYNKYFLSWGPLSRVISPEEPVKLYYLNYSGAGELRLKVKLYTEETETTSTLQSISPATDKSIHEIVLSPEKVGYSGLATREDRSLIKFDVWIADGSDVRISEIRTYVMDYTWYEHARYFLFRNSLGVYECLRATGLMSKDDTYSIEETAVMPASDYTSRDRQIEIVQKGEQQKFSLALGWLTRYSDSAEEYRNWLRDFSLSKEVYQLIGNTIKPITIKSTNIEQGKDGDELAGFSFEFTNAFTDEHFTREITWNLTDSSFNSDFEKAQ